MAETMLRALCGHNRAMIRLPGEPTNGDSEEGEVAGERKRTEIPESKGICTLRSSQ